MRIFFFSAYLWQVLGLICYAQPEKWNWVFGDSLGIRFENGSSISHFRTHKSGSEFNSSITDTMGNLKFYVAPIVSGSSFQAFTGNIKVLNHLNHLVENGDSIAGLSTVTQGALFLPIDSIYYLLTLSPPLNLSYEYMVQYYTGMDYGFMDYGFKVLYMTKIVSNVEHPEGIVIDKNNPIFTHDLYSGLSEKLGAARHSNGKDWWIITHTNNTDSFIVLLLTHQGISEIGIQKIGQPHETAFGEMDIADDGSKVGLVDYGWQGLGLIEIFDFNRCTGKFSNPEVLNPSNSVPISSIRRYGCAFSHNKTKFYITCNDPVGVYQFDLFASPISESETLIYNFSAPSASVSLGQLERAPDGKVFIRRSNLWELGSNLIAIGFPDSVNPEISVVSIEGDKGGVDLPNFPAYAPPLYENPAGPDAYFCDANPPQIGKNNGVDTSIYHPIYEWAPCLGLSCCDCERPLAFPETTTQYTLRVVVEGGCEFFDSVIVMVENVALPMLQDTSVCQGKSFVMPRGSGIYSWSPAVTETESSYLFTPLETTTYTLSYSETGNCFAVDSFRITVIPRYVSVGGFEASYPDTFDAPPFSVRFTSLTLGVDSSLFVWYFGDSTSAIGLGNPVHVYPDTGSYVVSFVMLPPPGYCGASVYSHTIRLVVRYTTDTTSRTPPLLEGGPRGEVRVYPNPTQDEVRIYSERMNCTLTLYDATGKQILGDVQVFAGVETKLSIKHLQDGVYFVKFMTQNSIGYTLLRIMR